jgi:hypothetical protein
VKFRIHIDDELVDEFNRIAGETGKTRNALIREALQEWLVRRRRSRWPAKVTSLSWNKGESRASRTAARRSSRLAIRSVN